MTCSLLIKVFSISFEYADLNIKNIMDSRSCTQKYVYGIMVFMFILNYFQLLWIIFKKSQK